MAITTFTAENFAGDDKPTKKKKAAPEPVVEEVADEAVEASADEPADEADAPTDED